MNVNLENSVKFLSQKYNDARLAIVLGSGLSSLVDLLTEKTVVSYSEIPSFPKSTAPSHKGELVFGQLEGVPVVMMNGRFHHYEGYSAQEITEYLKVLKGLGVRSVLFTNAAGSLSMGHNPGDLVILTDHINITGVNPLRGENDDTLGPRFVSMTNCYCPKNIETMQSAASELEIPVKTGVYAWYLGPSFETAAEIKMLHGLGADIVGMSTVPEVIMARYLDLDVTAVSCVTNYGTGITGEAITLEEVVEVTKKSNEQFSRLVRRFVQAKNEGA